LAVAPLLIVGAASVVIRFTQARGDERQQLKWVASAAAAIAMGALLSFTLVLGGWLALLDDLSILALPIAIAIAILRYRLYDIDRLIIRTIAYTIVTGLLAAGYAGMVLLLHIALPVSQRSSIVVAATTLAMVALFGPLRDRVQALVDRRFNRRRYDAQRTLDSFGATLRSETNLDILSSDLVAVVTDTMQPIHVSLWLRRVDAAQ
jgi:hypothetical protein